MTLVDGDPAHDVPLDDRGLAYGDGVFETIAVVAGQPALWSRHYERLSSGCRLLGFTPPASDVLLDDLKHEACDGDGVIRITVTRGSGGRGYRAPKPAQPRRIVKAAPLPDYPIGYWCDGVAARLCSTRLPHRPALDGLKHLNRIEQVLARSEWDDPAVAEGLMLTPDGTRVGEGSMSNLFAVMGDEVITPPIRGYGVAGVMREQILAELEDQGRSVREAWLAVEDLAVADEVFVTNSIIGLWPVREVEGRVLTREWPLCRELLARLTGKQAMVDWLGEPR